MAIVYISKEGKSTNNGTMASPYNNITDGLVDNNTIYLRQGNYDFDELSITGKDNIKIKGYSNENVIFNGTRNIINLAEVNQKWEKIEQKTINESNQLITKDIYRIKLKSDVVIWQLFHDLNEIISARYPSAQWTDDSVYNKEENWGHGYYNPSNPPEYNNGEIIDFPTSSINLKEWVSAYQSNINSNFTLVNSIINLNVGSFKSYSRKVKSMTIDNNIKLTYDQVPLWKEKHHYYYLESRLEFLNSENEWYFDNTTKYLYVCLTGNRNPAYENIYAKVQNYSLNLRNCTNIEISNINFFGTTLQINNSANIKVDNCNFLYPSCYAKMLGEINRGTLIENETEFFNQMTKVNSSSNCEFNKCAFKYTDGCAIEMYGGNNLIQDCYFNYIDKTVTDLSSVMTSIRMNGVNNVFRRNTVHKSGASSTLNCGDEAIIEYNDLSESGYLQSDGAMIHCMVNQQPNVKIRYNWVHDSIKYGIRFDGDGAGYNGYIHHNVVWNCTGGIMIKGGELEKKANIISITNTNPIVITVEPGHNILHKERITIGKVKGMVELNNNDYYASVYQDEITLYSDVGLNNYINGISWGVYESNGVICSGESVGGHFVYNNTILNSIDKNDIMALNIQANLNINYETIVMNNLVESISGTRTGFEELSDRMYNSNNYVVTDLENYILDYSNRDFRPKDSLNIVGQADTTPTAARTYVGINDFNPGEDDDKLTADIGALLFNNYLWCAGISWDNLNYDNVVDRYGLYSIINPKNSSIYKLISDGSTSFSIQYYSSFKNLTIVNFTDSLILKLVNDYLVCEVKKGEYTQIIESMFPLPSNTTHKIDVINGERLFYEGEQLACKYNLEPGTMNPWTEVYIGESNKASELYYFQTGIDTKPLVDNLLVSWEWRRECNRTIYDLRGMRDPIIEKNMLMTYADLKWSITVCSPSYAKLIMKIGNIEIKRIDNKLQIDDVLFDYNNIFTLYWNGEQAEIKINGHLYDVDVDLTTDKIYFHKRIIYVIGYPYIKKN